MLIVVRARSNGEKTKRGWKKERGDDGKTRFVDTRTKTCSIIEKVYEYVWFCAREKVTYKRRNGLKYDYRRTVSVYLCRRKWRSDFFNTISRTTERVGRRKNINRRLIIRCVRALYALYSTRSRVYFCWYSVDAINFVTSRRSVGISIYTRRATYTVIY